MPPRVRCAVPCGLGSAMKPTRLSTPSAVQLFPPAPTTASATRQYATAAVSNRFQLPSDYVPPTQPPTARQGDTRKSQLLRTYTSLLRSSPLILIFQYNNLTAVEWAAVRRELGAALAEVSTEGTESAEVAANTHIQSIRGRMFDIALKIVEFYDPSNVAPVKASTLSGEKVDVVYNHDLSAGADKAMRAAVKKGGELLESSVYAQILPLLVGPLAVLTIPAVSPAHLGAALRVLAPSPPAFPAPTRKKRPGYHDPIAQSGLQKLMLIGGRIEGKIFDLDGVKWVGGIEGGLDGLRAQLVHMLQSAGMGLASTLEGASKSLWLTLESRRSVLEEEQNGGKKEEEKKEEQKEGSS